MTHDPFQTYAHYGVPSPLGLQYPSLQPSAINPVAALNAILGLSPMAQVAGMNPIQSFINPQQLQQLASLLGLQNPYWRLPAIRSLPLVCIPKCPALTVYPSSDYRRPRYIRSSGRWAHRSARLVFRSLHKAGSAKAD